MKILIFNWTSEQLITGKKKLTVRNWEYGNPKAYTGEIVQAYDNSPLYNGHRIGFVKILGMSWKKLKNITEKEIKAEGMWHRNKEEYIEFMKKKYPNFDNDSKMCFVHIKYLGKGERKEWIKKK